MHPKWKLYKGKRIDKGYERYVKGKPCLVCKTTPVDIHHTWHRRSDSYSAVPLCRKHHTADTTSYHHLEHEKFEEFHNLNLLWEIYNLLSEYIGSLND